MSQLIEIKTVPIEIEMKVSAAKLEYTRASADLEISRDKGGLNIKSRPIRLNVDTFETRNPMVPSSEGSMKQYAQKGRQVAYKANAVYQQGGLLLKAKIGEDVLARYSPSAPSPDSGVGRDAGEMNIKFEMDKLNFEWRIHSNEFKFTPGDIEISVKQQPDVIIKYIGGPLYVPPSADPNYKAVDVNA